MSQPINEETIRDYCINHELSRPTINIKKVLVITGSVISITGIISYALCLLVDFSFWAWFDIIINILLITFGKTILKFSIHCYQCYASKKIRRQCCCMPSCSEYALIALDKYIWPKALWKICYRITHTCYKPGYHLDYP